MIANNPTTAPTVSGTTENGAICYKPSELIALFSAVLGRQSEFAKLVWLTGVYKQRTRRPGYDDVYGVLHDESSPAEITLRIPQDRADELVDGNVVTIAGTLHRQIDQRASVKLIVKVSRIERQQKQLVDPLAEKRAEFRRKKQQVGFRNVDGPIERKLLEDEKPAVALILATHSITFADFEAELQAAKGSLLIKQFRADFSAQSLSASLRETDNQGFDAIAVVRGGGPGLEHLDDDVVLETLCGMKTPVIAAVGHSEERILFKELADREVSTPAGLGKYLNDLVERTAEAKAKSKALLLKQVEKQYAGQVADLKRQLGEHEKKHQVECATYQKQLADQSTAQKAELQAFQQQLDQQHKSHLLEQEQLRKQFDVQVTNLQKRFDEQKQASQDQEQKFQKEREDFKQQLAAFTTAQKEERLAHQQQLEQQSKTNALEREQLRTQAAEQMASFEKRLSEQATKAQEQEQLFQKERETYMQQLAEQSASRKGENESYQRQLEQQRKSNELILEQQRMQAAEQRAGLLSRLDEQVREARNLRNQLSDREKRDSMLAKANSRLLGSVIVLGIGLVVAVGLLIWQLSN
jgi:hypothetical protein